MNQLPMRDGETHDPSDEQESAAFEALFRPRLTRRQRAWRAAAVVGTVLLALAVIVSGVPALRAGLVNLLTATAIIPDSGNAVYLDTNLPDMVVTLDGQVVPQNELGARKGLHLARGQHTLTWRASPFEPQSCTFSIPARPGDTCARIASASTGGLITEPDSSLLLLHISLTTLDGTQRDALFDALKLDGADYTTTVQAGESYLTSASGAVVAQQPLRAMLELDPDISAQDDMTAQLPTCIFSQRGNATNICPANISLGACAAMCILPFSESAANFYTLVPVHLSWTYYTLDGAVVLRDQPYDAGGAALSQHYALAHVWWDGTDWHANLAPTFDADRQVFAGNHLLTTDLGCIGAADMVLDASSAAPFAADFHAGNNPADGCVITAAVPDGQGLSVATVLLYRFGVLLTANDGARQLLPFLPTATGETLALAQQLAQAPGWSTDTLPLGVLDGTHR